MTSNLTESEQEIIFLDAVFDLISSMVNFQNLSVEGTDPDCNVKFKTSVHQRLFSIFLVDFLSPTDPRSPVGNKPFLRALCELSDKR